MPSTELSTAIAGAHRALLQYPDACLPLPWRRRLRAALGPLDDGPAGRGWTGRWHLALRCAERALSRWRSDHPGDRRPERIVGLAAAVFAGETGASDAARQCAPFLDDIRYGSDRFSVRAYFAGNAVAALLRVAATGDVGDDVPPGTLDADLEPDAWDIEGLTVAAEASVPGEPDDDPARRRDVWRWYLRDAVPAAHAAARTRYEDARQRPS